MCRLLKVLLAIFSGHTAKDPPELTIEIGKIQNSKTLLCKKLNIFLSWKPSLKLMGQSAGSLSNETLMANFRAQLSRQTRRPGTNTIKLFLL